MCANFIKKHLLYLYPLICLSANGILFTCALSSRVAAQDMLFGFDMPPKDSTEAWLLFSDAAMHGNSTAEFEIEDSTATFKGFISLKNDGGIAQAISPEQNEDWQLYNGVLLRVKGDGKDYILSLQHDPITSDGKHLEYRFKTLKDAWIEVAIDFAELQNTYYDAYITASPIKLDDVRYFTIINAYQEGRFALQIDWLKLY